MISTSEATSIIEKHIRQMPVVTLPVSAISGMVLATDVLAPYEIPSFQQSSMDGFAFSFDEWEKNTALMIKGEVAAGQQPLKFEHGTAVRIFTGAAVPEGADTVIMQEKTEVADGKLLITDKNIRKGLNVRPIGSEIRKGEIALKKDSVLTPAAIGFLAGIGIAEAKVYRKPRISIIVTGNELLSPGSGLEEGKIFESNSLSLKASLHQNHFTDINCMQVADDAALLKNIIGRELESSDFVLLTGGISVGAYDFVKEAVQFNEVTMLFHGVKQRPGKPLFFGNKGTKIVFGLPGNPSSVLTCFYEYVLPALQKSVGIHSHSNKIKVPLKEKIEKPAGLTFFLKGYYNGNEVKALGAQESYKLNSFATANCFIVLDEEVTGCKKGELVDVHLIES